MILLKAMNRFRRVLTVLLVLVVASCAEIPVEEAPELVWPLPPQRPRIKFLDLIIGSADVATERDSKFKKLLFGGAGEREYTFSKPSFNAVVDDVLYVTDRWGIYIYDFKKKTVKLMGSDLLGNPAGIDVSSDGDILVGDMLLKAVYLMRPKAKKVARVGAGTLKSPGGVAFDEKNGRLVIVDVKEHNVKVYDRDGKFVFAIGERGTETGKFNFPYDVEVDDRGDIYVVDSGNFRVQKFDSTGKHLLSFGSVGISPGQFARPKAIALDSDDNIYVVDAAFANFQIFDKHGRALLAVGTTGREPGQFLLPIGIAIDRDDKVYVVDQLNKRIQIFQYISYPEEKP